MKFDTVGYICCAVIGAAIGATAYKVFHYRKTIDEANERVSKVYEEEAAKMQMKYDDSIAELTEETSKQTVEATVIIFEEIKKLISGKNISKAEFSKFVEAVCNRYENTRLKQYVELMKEKGDIKNGK